MLFIYSCLLLLVPDLPPTRLVSACAIIVFVFPGLGFTTSHLGKHHNEFAYTMFAIIVIRVVLFKKPPCGSNRLSNGFCLHTRASVQSSLAALSIYRSRPLRAN